ncbi:hypothetical protein BC629DRAFT_1596229 [Irpex lacteus]|nr:hypothetical protein BC629DRAFT_1596204 [Irpex lacteus]KAI0767973.1 hypothetical protein BC629DRAFT_1596229 [Irpex lacteus]
MASPEDSSHELPVLAPEVPDGLKSLTPIEDVSNEPPAPPAGSPPLQISPIFNFGAGLLDVPSDTLILSSDGIFFAVHAHILLTASKNNLANLLIYNNFPTVGTRASLLATEPSDTLTVLLLSLYSLPFNPTSCSFHTLISALPAFAKYGLTPLPKYICRGTPLFDAILYHAPLHAIETYALAAAAGLEDLAVSSSAYTLSRPVHTIPQKLMDLIGTTYVHRLVMLQGMRMDNFKEWLDEKIYPHVAKPYCSAEKRREVSVRYGAACAQVFYVAFPAMTRATIEVPMRALIDSIQCPDCKQSLETRVNDMCTKWLLLPRTISLK